MASQKVFVSLMGGLGNQLFQYAAGLAFMDNSGTKSLYLLPAAKHEHSSTDYRPLMHRGAMSDQPTGPLATFSNGGSFQPWTPKAPGLLQPTQLLLHGYFQFLPAIAQQVATIATDLLVSFSDLRANLRSKYSIEHGSQSAFLHVRRGDYLKHQGHWILPISYYLEAIASLPKSTRIFIISDDPAWCAAQEEFQDKRFLIADEPSEITSLALMSLCGGGAIIANSTFSWWGAILAMAAAPDCPVFYPSIWFGAEIPYLFPSNWICLDV